MFEKKTSGSVAADAVSMLELALADATGDPVGAWQAVVNWVRPHAYRKSTRRVQAESRLQALVDALDLRTDLRTRLQDATAALAKGRRSVLLFATSGIYPDTGVLTETARRLAFRLLPEAQEPEQLKSTLGSLFRRGDAEWLGELPAGLWVALIRTLAPSSPAQMPGPDPVRTRFAQDHQEAVRVLAHRIAAAGLDPEMLRLEPRLERHESPFMALCDEAVALAQAYGEQIGSASPALEQVADHHRHLLVLLDQCRAAIERVRRTAQREGASFRLTFRLRRLSQHLWRLQSLVDLLASWDGDDAILQRRASLLRELVLAECRRHDLRRFWSQNTELVALRVAENAGRSGEHYITSTRSEYIAMLRAAAGGGLVVALMAVVKIRVEAAALAPLTEVLANCLNYGLGFVLVHLLHLAVATKQPAMTANAIAAALDAPGAGARAGARSGRVARERFDTLVQLVARTVRTQLAAVAGNIAVALPVAMSIATGVWWATGQHFVSSDKAHTLLAGLQPLASGALVYAALAGVCLFAAGMIAGFYDNLCAYNRIPQRLLQLQTPRRWVGAQRWARVAAYVENNLGALAGNFSLGFLLGGVAGMGTLLGLALDVRHVTLTSANWGFAMTSLNTDAPWQVAGMAALGVGLIGMINLGVSFGLALWIALKSRGVKFDQGRRLVGEIVRGFWRQPREFLLPPRAGQAAPDGSMEAPPRQP